MSAAASVSVICVNYNAGDLLIEVVRSALADANVRQVLVSDNGSSDGSIDALREALGAIGASSRLQIIENNANLGFSRGNNVALDAADGDYLLFLNPDCVLEAGTLDGMLAFMAATPAAGMAGCVIRNPDGSEQASGRRSIPDPFSSLARFTGLGSSAAKAVDLGDQPLPDQPMQVEAISGAFMLVRRAALEVVGPLDEDYFLHCEDLDWFVRFNQAGWQIWFVPGYSVVHHKGTCSKATPIAVEWHKHSGMVRFFRKFQLRQYPWIFGALVVVGVWARFLLVATKSLFRR